MALCGLAKPLRRCFRMSEVATLDLDTQWAMALSRLELLLCIGPLVPLLLAESQHVSQWRLAAEFAGGQ